ncbi:MAG: hypothetical protein R3324_08485 [Halobacteriales archaeon]|nr:hypothetical protein [Halobacteriales archaeon]
MADEFIKGLGIFTAAGLGWMIFAGWYTTPGFEDTQLIGEAPADPDVWGQFALVVKDGLFWFAILGALTFWVIIPAIKRARDAYAERNSE